MHGRKNMKLRYFLVRYKYIYHLSRLYFEFWLGMEFPLILGADFTIEKKYFCIISVS